MSTQHTPGPWEAIQFRGEIRYVMKAGTPLIICELSPTDQRENARLIAAAPRSLEALQDADALIAMRGKPPETAEELAATVAFAMATGTKVRAAIKAATEGA